MNSKISQQQRRKSRVRGNIFGSAERPRLSVYRSNRYINAQIIDDTQGKTLVALGEKSLSSQGGTPLDRAEKLGESLAKLANQKKIKRVVFDRGSYQFHGRVKALAQGARKGGLEF
jgi:large subunit ribosomal protein L18